MKKAIALVTAVMTMLSVFALGVKAAPPEGIERASSAILVDAGSGTVIFGKDEDKKTEVAGLKRLPYLLLICEAFDSEAITGETIVTVSPSAAAVKGSTAFLAPNERIPAEHLLKAAVMITAGDATAALMDALYPSADAQREAVLSRLASLGIDRATFDAEEQFSASEIARVCLALSRSKSFLKYSSVYLDSIPHEKAGDTELTNPNRLVRFYSGCYGLATGSVGSTEYAGAFIAKRGNTAFIAVLAGMPDSASRFALAEEMLNAGFSSFKSANVFEADEAVGSVRVEGGSVGFVDAVVRTNGSVLLPVGETKVSTEILLPSSIEAPVDAGAEIGSVIVRNTKGEALGEVPLYAKNAVPKARFSDILMGLILSWLRSSPSQ